MLHRRKRYYPFWLGCHLWPLSATVLVLLALPALAGEPLPSTPRRYIVGGSRVVSAIPDLSHAQLTEGRSPRPFRIHIDQASFLKPHFVDVNLRPGDTLIVRTAEGRVVEEITGRGPKNAGTFWGLSAFGDTLILELISTHPYPQPPFRIDQVIVGDASFLLKEPFRSGPESICGSQTDFEDVACYRNDATKWANVQASVGIMTVEGNPASPDPNVGIWCSGVNVSPENFVLTNQHCIQNQAECDNAEVIFRFRRQDCNNGSLTTTWKSYRCQEVVLSSPFEQCDASLDGLDFSLLSIMGNPSATFGFATPDANPVTSGEEVYIIQHPEGRPQEITHGDGADFIVDDTGLRYFGSLDTEPGSSGAPIFRTADSMLVGLHHCSGCETRGVGNRGIRMSDIYPMIAPFLCTTSLTLSGVEGVDLHEVSGNGNSAIEPGEIWQFTPRIRNTSCSSEATNVAAYVRVNPASHTPITLLDTRVSFGTVPAGQTVSAMAPVRFQLDAAFPCGGWAILDLIGIVAASGEAFPDTRNILSAQVGSRESTTLLFEDFSAGIPTTWKIGHGGTGSGSAATWTTTNPGRRTLGLTAPFAIADSDALGPGQTMNESLISPIVNTTGFSHVTLQFSHVFNWYRLGQNEQAFVEVRSRATGGKWIKVAKFSPGDASGVTRFDLTAQAAGHPDVRIRFRYTNAKFEQWWAVDDIFLLADHGMMCEAFTRPKRIFADSFESGNLAAWSRQSRHASQDLKTTTRAALAGTTKGLQVTINDTKPLYVQDDSPDGESRYRVRFYFDPHGIRMPDPSQFQILSLFGESRPIHKLLTVVLRFNGGQYWLAAFTRRDDNLWVTSDFFVLSPGPHVVEIDWAKATSPGANDGWMRLWLDDRLVATLQHLDNDERVVDLVRLGAVSSVGANIYGTMYFDHFVSQRRNPIGP